MGEGERRGGGGTSTRRSLKATAAASPALVATSGLIAASGSTATPETSSQRHTVLSLTMCRGACALMLTILRPPVEIRGLLVALCASNPTVNRITPEMNLAVPVATQTAPERQS